MKVLKFVAPLAFVVLMSGTAHAQTSCATPDPFVALGGGTCHQGDWFPPGMAIPGARASAPAPAPVPRPNRSICATPDPFVALGGGTCHQGGWLPPGMPIPGGAAASTVPAPAPAGSSPSVCATPDPFVALGGGTCYRSDWFPPGMSIPGGNAGSPAPSPAAAPASSSSCATPDPFVVMGGGTCYQGGWLPPGMAIPGGGSASPTRAPSAAPAPEVQPVITGVKLRVLQWNLHHGVGSDGRYDIERIATWMAKMAPDVVMLNEVEKNTSWGREDQPARYAALLEQKTGRKWYGHFTQEFGDGSNNGKGHLILSVYPLESVGNGPITPSDGLKGAGAVGQATITVNGRTINLLISHLDPESQAMRLTQAQDTIRWAQGFAENRILAGDMNAWPDQASIAEYMKTYGDSWAVAERNGAATAFAGLTPSGATRKGRIDYIFYSKGAANLVVKGSRVYDTRDASGVMASDHRPVVTTFDVR